MHIVKCKPTSPGRRHQVKIVYDDLYRGRPFAGLLSSLNRKAGRNNQGRISVRHKGGGHKRLYRLIDFKRNNEAPAVVERVEYDPNRSSHIALLKHENGLRSYVLAAKGLVVGKKVEVGKNVPVTVGNVLPLANIPVGTIVHCVEMKPGKGAQIARSAGTSVQIVAKEYAYCTIKLRSGEMRKILSDCKAVIGEVGNAQHSLRSLGKAGANRWRGVRPTVRGVAMNPVDHPHGGGEGKTSGGRHPVTPWGVPTKGYKTRKNKQSDRYIVRSRHGK